MSKTDSKPKAPKLVFKNPPADGRKKKGPRGSYTDRAIAPWLDAIRKSTRKGFVVYPDPIAAATGTHINKGTAYGVTAGEFTAVTRPDPNGSSSQRILYVRKNEGFEAPVAAEA